MLTKLLISILIIESVVVNTLRVQDSEEYYDDRDPIETTTKPTNDPLAAPTPTTSPPSTTNVASILSPTSLVPEREAIRHWTVRQRYATARVVSMSSQNGFSLIPYLTGTPSLDTYLPQTVRAILNAFTAGTPLIWIWSIWRIKWPIMASMRSKCPVLSVTTCPALMKTTLNGSLVLILVL